MRCMQRHPGLSFAGTRLEAAEPFAVSGVPLHSEAPALFLHIPKTGGTTVHFAIMAALESAIEAGRASYTRYRVPRVEGESPVALRPGWIGSWPEVLARAPAFTRPASPAFFSAHCPFGFHELLGLDNAVYFALVRDPVERELSNFNFLYQRGFLDATNTLEGLLNAGEILDNPQARMLAGVGAMSGAFGEAEYQQALRHLEHHFVLAATAKQLQPFLRALLGLWNLPPVAYVWSQVTGLKLQSSISAELERRLRALHAYDDRLVCHVEDRFTRWLARHAREGPPLEPAAEYLVVDSRFSTHRTAGRSTKLAVQEAVGLNETLVPLGAKE